MKDFLNRINPRIYIALSGFLLGLAVIFAEIGLVAFIAMIPLAMMLYRRAEKGEYRIKKAYLDGFIFYMSFDIVIFHWFTYFYPLEFAGLTKEQAIGVIALAWIGLSALQSIFSALVFVLISRFTKTEIYKNHPILLAPYAAVLWAVNEWTQTFTWAGVPWGRVAISQTEMPVMMQNASLFGSYFLTFVIVLFNFLVAYAIMYSNKRKMASKIAIVVFLAHVLCGTMLYFIPFKDEDRSIKVATVQGNLESQSNWDVTNSETYDIYDELTKKAADEGAKLIIWPEGVMAVDIDTMIKPADSGYMTIRKAVTNLADSLDVTIVVGTYVYDSDKIYNSMSVFYPNGSSIINAYAKIKLVPFGEFMPMRDFISAIVPALAQINMLSYDINAGSKPGIFPATTDEDGIKVGTLICFDSIYETIAIKSARAGAEMFIVPSNDSWFYDSRAMNMHHSQNVLRAVEQGKYTVNCGNTGITSVLSDKGVILDDMPIYQEGYVIETVYANNSRTLYSYIGNLFVYLCVVSIFVPFVLNIWYKKKLK
jgi:apolipoprotein N-acyltransferase